MFVDIYFADLNEQKQKQFLVLAGVEDPEEMNWDIHPIATIEMGFDEEEDE